jgi:hypothetical protein
VRLVTLFLLLLAPAPLPKPPAKLPEAFVGSWRLQWGAPRRPESYGTCRIDAGGDWRCDLNGAVWVGHWELEGTTLVIRERLVWCGRVGGDPTTYRVWLDETGRAGTVQHAFPFRLTRPAK